MKSTNFVTLQSFALIILNLPNKKKPACDDGIIPRSFFFRSGETAGTKCKECI
jgi:hypothetical protein